MHDVRTWLLHALLLSSRQVAAKGLVASVGNALKPSGDTPVVAIACCGAGRLPAAPAVLSQALGALPGSEVSVVDEETPIVLMDVAHAGTADLSAAVAACDVLALEVRFADLVDATPHGLAQLLPLLQHWVRMREASSDPKELLLTIVDFDASEVSEADVAAFASAQLNEIVASAVPEDVSSTLSTTDLVQLKCSFVPREAASTYEAALDALKSALADAPSQTASGLIASISQAADIVTPTAPAASPAEVHAAYQCGLLAEAAARDFQKGASALRKAADGALLTDFGEQVSISHAPAPWPPSCVTSAALAMP